MRIQLIQNIIDMIRRKHKRKKYLENVFKRSYEKKVLISYIKHPFIQGVSKRHSNRLECLTAASIFDELGYQVDVMHYEDELETEKLNEYSIVYGFGKPFSSALANPSITTIYYATGCSTTFSNIATIQKAREFYHRTGISAQDSIRYSSLEDISVKVFADKMIILGNDFVKNTYVEPTIKQNIESLNAFYFDTYDIDIDKKNYSKIKKNFVWFGSLGAIHKGLDIVIDIFKSRRDINLTICGFHDIEKQFANHYQDVLDGKYSNIKNCGFVDIESELFKDIMDTHSAVVYPSISEGCAVSLLNVMANGGLIPIASTASGLNIREGGGVSSFFMKSPKRMLRKTLMPSLH